MEIKFIPSRSCASGELKVSEGGAQITEDVVRYVKDQGWLIDDSTIDNLIQVAYDMSRFNKKSDLDFVHRIVTIFLSDSEKEQLIECIKEPA